MKKIREYTGGPHIYMALELDSGERHEIDVYIRETGETYKTTGDDIPETRDAIIAAFKALY